MTPPFGDKRTFSVSCKLCRVSILSTARLDDVALRDLRGHLDAIHPGVLRVGFYAPDVGAILREFDIVPE